jgi:putative ATPase
MDLFDTTNKTKHHEPLAYRIRPTSLNTFFGQKHILEKNTLFRKKLECGNISSCIFWGPPGVGKTTLIHIISTTIQANFISINAVNTGAKEIRELGEKARFSLKAQNTKTLLFIDEVHRLNKAQQDILLPFSEDGSFVFMGATTENPYFQINSALLSRCEIIELFSLSKEDLLYILNQAITNTEYGYGHSNISIEDEAKSYLCTLASGDARTLLNLLEIIISSGHINITKEIIRKNYKNSIIRYDKKGERHYDCISAFIKSLRGSDTDAALFWMFYMLKGGEDPLFLFRRMLIFSSEDIGMADSNALSFTKNAFLAFEKVGLKEGEYFLSHACIYLSLAPKSNAVKKAMEKTKQYLKDTDTVEIPRYLRNAPIIDMKKHEIGIGYKYPHDYPKGVVTENYFPINNKKKIFYTPSLHGDEKFVLEKIKKIRKILN